MSVRQIPQQLLAREEIVAPPKVDQAWQDYSFELPPAIHLAMAAMFLGFVGVLTLAVSDSAMAVPFGIFTAFIAAFFAIPVIFVKAAPKGSARPMRWSELMDRGIAIENGRCSGREAVVLSLMLPAFILGWALAIAAIIATL